MENMFKWWFLFSATHVVLASIDYLAHNCLSWWRSCCLVTHLCSMIHI